MKMKGLLGLILVLLIALASGCAENEEALKAAEVYTKAIQAMEEANSFEFDMEMAQVTQFPPSVIEEGGPDKMEVQTTGSGRAVQDPMAMEMTMIINMPGMADIPEAAVLGEMEMQMYMVGNEMYMIDSMSGVWLKMDMSDLGMDLEELAGLGQAETDPMYLLTLLGEEGAAEATLETDGDHYVIIVDDAEGQVMQKLIDEFVQEQLGDSILDMQMALEEDLDDLDLQAELEELYNNISFSDMYFKVWIEQETFFTTKVEMSMKMAMTFEGETMETETSSVTTYRNFGSFDSITVPDEVKNNALSFEEYMESMLMDFDFDFDELDPQELEALEELLGQ
ncbi:DUF6612 family protein [Dethiobacter alkaliphilus]|uniref:DUF6612 family protein n=1 Tax=Dethiobacter alkaliphilus TaxID=427926 RepID=UPI002227C7E9|nr:DUF6612 family protein [Dethiobacter alkaliphilus]MCW3491597.1 hypothetical protein [Dethiobacter alkaliphilus]